MHGALRARPMQVSCTGPTLSHSRKGHVSQAPSQLQVGLCQARCQRMCRRRRPAGGAGGAPTATFTATGGPVAAGVVVTAGGAPAVGKGDSGGGGGLGGHLALFRLVIAAVQERLRQLRRCSLGPLLKCHMPMEEPQA